VKFTPIDLSVPDPDDDGSRFPFTRGLGGHLNGFEVRAGVSKAL